MDTSLEKITQDSRTKWNGNYASCFGKCSFSNIVGVDLLSRIFPKVTTDPSSVSTEEISCAGSCLKDNLYDPDMHRICCHLVEKLRRNIILDIRLRVKNILNDMKQYEK